MRHYLPAVCAAVAALAGAIAVLPQAGAHRAPTANTTNQSDQNPCIVTHTMSASPEVLLLGEEVTVTLGVQASCPDTPGPMHVVLVLDGSRTMAGPKTQQMKQAAARLIQGLDLNNTPSTKVGVVEYNWQARRLCSLTNDENLAIGCVNLVGAIGGTRIDLGIMEGRSVLNYGRGGLHPTELTEVMIVLADGIGNWACAEVVAAASLARGQGVLVMVVCIGDDCDEQCVRQAASGPQYYYLVPEPRDLAAAFDAILDHLLEDRLRHLSITYEWGDRFAFIGDSAIPHQSEPTVPEDWLRWEQDHVAMPAPGVTYSLRLRPLEAGSQPVGEDAQGVLFDQRGRTLSWQFDLPLITVLDPAAPPTATTTPNPSLTPVSTPAATATATPSTAPLYLPRTVRHD